MYEDTYTKFDPALFKYGGYEVRDICPDQPYAEWNYGDTFTLTFDLTDYLASIADLSDYFVVFQIFNYRHEATYEGCGKAEDLIVDNIFSFIVGSDLSANLIKGNYTCQLILKSADTQCTLFDRCKLHVR